MNGITYRAADLSDALCIGVLGTQVFPDTYAPEGMRPGLAREVLGNFSMPAIGSELLQRAEALAARNGAAAMWLTAWVENARAVLYYPRRGYQDVGASTYSFDDDHYENRVFVKVLAHGGGSAPSQAVGRAP